MTDILAILASAGLWAAVLRIATPLILGTLGELLCERAGVLNLGIEGIMTFGAMIGWLAVFNGADLWTGLLVAALSGARTREHVKWALPRLFGLNALTAAKRIAARLRGTSGPRPAGLPAT